MKNIQKFWIFFAIFLVLIIPVFSFAQETDAGLVPCTGPDCDWNAFMKLINNVINFIIKNLALPICAIMFAYAGFELVTSGGSTEKRGKARKIFTNTAIGFIIILAAWLIVSLVLSILGFDGSWIGF